ncbi:MAG: hypothetical protein NVSMB29_11820 [Candidatus Dormibacteria bacterium]
MSVPGYEHVAMASTSELRLPAEREYILVAKRAAASFGCVAGFGVEAVDDLTIAVAQACENAIAMCTCDGATAELRLLFKLNEGRLDVQVRSVRTRESRSEAAERAAAARERRLAEARELERAQAASELALQMMGLFVDDCRWGLDQRSGGLRVRLTKYRAS